MGRAAREAGRISKQSRNFPYASAGAACRASGRHLKAPSARYARVRARTLKAMHPSPPPTPPSAELYIFPPNKPPRVGNFARPRMRDVPSAAGGSGESFFIAPLLMERRRQYLPRNFTCAPARASPAATFFDDSRACADFMNILVLQRAALRFRPSAMTPFFFGRGGEGTRFYGTPFESRGCATLTRGFASRLFGADVPVESREFSGRDTPLISFPERNFRFSKPTFHCAQRMVRAMVA